MVAISPSYGYDLHIDNELISVAFAADEAEHFEAAVRLEALTFLQNPQSN